jgi:branched-chain amino acid transport system permease protein
VCSGMSFVLGVLRVPNVAHGSLYMIGAFSAFSISSLFGGSSAGFWLALIIAPLIVALVSLIAERALFCHLYEREHLMLLLFTFALMLILGDLVKLTWGADYRSIMAPPFLRGSVPVFGSSFPRYNLFLLVIGPLVAISLYFFTNKTKMGKIARAAAVDREMVGAVGINVSWVFAVAFVIGCYLAGLGGALVAPTVSITLGMEHDIIIEAFLIVTIGGLGNMWGALVGSLIFGLTQAFGVLFWPQFAIVFPYAAVVIILIIWPTGMLKAVW